MWKGTFVLVYVANAIAFLLFCYQVGLKLLGRRMRWDVPLYVIAEAMVLVLLGSNIFVYLSGEGEIPVIVDALCANAFLMTTWATRAGVLVSLIHSFRILDYMIYKSIVLSCVFLCAGIVFSVTGAIICVTRGGLQHLSFAFKVSAICGDVIADTYVAFIAFRFFMATTLGPKLKIFTLAGWCGPLSTMFITTTSWILSLTIFSSNLRAQLCMFNVSACYSVAMTSMPAIMHFFYKRHPDFQSTDAEMVGGGLPVVFGNFKVSDIGLQEVYDSYLDSIQPKSLED